MTIRKSPSKRKAVTTPPTKQATRKAKYKKTAKKLLRAMT